MIQELREILNLNRQQIPVIEFVLVRKTVRFVSERIYSPFLNISFETATAFLRCKDGLLYLTSAVFPEDFSKSWYLRFLFYFGGYCGDQKDNCGSRENCDC